MVESREKQLGSSSPTVNLEIVSVRGKRKNTTSPLFDRNEYKWTQDLTIQKFKDKDQH